jgi:tetratricopeptide (TPR) repeat protein
LPSTGDWRNFHTVSQVREFSMRYGRLLLGSGFLLLSLPGSAQDLPKATPAAEQAHPAEHDHTDQTTPKTAQLLEGYGGGGFAVTGANAQAQAFFSNGMELAAAFAHKASIAAMAEAVRLDPKCAMCRWGLAYTSGPTINYGKGWPERKQLYAMLGTAEELAQKTGTERERELIKVFRKRYLPGATIAKRDTAFAKDMLKLVKKYPDDNTIAVLAADALIQAMDEHNYKAEAMKAVGLLEVVLARAPSDTPAIHFYIHATEIARVPARAEPYADKLGGLAPRASHLVHMPSHTYYWVGRYQDAATVNHRAVELGKENALRLGLTAPNGVWGLPYHSHNVIFGLGGALMAGDAKIGLELGRELIDHSQAEEEAHPVMQLLASAGYFALARFDDPKAVLARPESKLPYLKAAWHYARGEAFAKLGNLAGLKTEIAALPSDALAKADPKMKAPDQMVAIVRLVLVGRLAMAEQRWADAATAFKGAAEIEETEDFMQFADPPAFWYPVRRDYAAALLAGGDKAGALREVDASLKLRPKDPVALELRGRIGG